MKLEPSGAECYLDEELGVAVIADAAGGAMPLEGTEAIDLHSWLGAVIALGRSRSTVNWLAKRNGAKKPSGGKTLGFEFGVEVGDEHAALLVNGERLHLDFEEQESLVEFVLQQFGKRRWQGIVAKALDAAVEAEIERRAKANEEPAA